MLSDAAVYVTTVLLMVVGCVICQEDPNSIVHDIPIPIEDVKLDFKQHITKDHVLEELQHEINTKERSDMSDRELQFHYFKLHDYDNNNLLDGLEIVKALKHNHEEEGDLTAGQPQSEDDLISIVDGVLDSDDYDKDGYISFYEFISSQGDLDDGEEPGEQ